MQVDSVTGGVSIKIGEGVAMGGAVVVLNPDTCLLCCQPGEVRTGQDAFS